LLASPENITNAGRVEAGRDEDGREMARRREREEGLSFLLSFFPR